MTITTILILTCCGIFISYIVGLIGAPSGTLYIPFLLTLTPYLLNGYDQHLIPIVMSTSSICIIISVVYSSYLAYKENQIEIEAIKNQWISLIIGGSLGALFVYFIQNQIIAMKIILGLLLISFARMIWFHLETDDDHESLSTKTLNKAWFILAATSSTFFGIGGQPYIYILLKKLYYTSRNALGTARLLNLISMLSSALIYCIWSLSFKEESQLLIGYFYWPAILIFGLTSMPFIHLGFKSAQFLPIRSIKKYYAVFTFLTGIWMILFAVYKHINY